MNSGARKCNTGIVVYLRDTWFGKLKIGNIK